MQKYVGLQAVCSHAQLNALPICCTRFIHNIAVYAFVHRPVDYCHHCNWALWEEQLCPSTAKAGPMDHVQMTALMSHFGTEFLNHFLVHHASKPMTSSQHKSIQHVARQRLQEKRRENKWTTATTRNGNVSTVSHQAAAGSAQTV